MDNQYQELISTFSGKHNLLLTSLLCTENPNTWEECKHLIISSTPLLTLEMAVNRITTKSRKNKIPTPQQIQQALSYANEKRETYLKRIATEPLVPS